MQPCNHSSKVIDVMKGRCVYSNLLIDSVNKNMTHQFLRLFKAHAAHMHNHLIHSADKHQHTDIQNTFAI